MLLPQPERTLRVGIVGLGLMGRNHLRVYRDLDNIEVVALADSDPATLTRAERNCQVVRTYLDYRKMFDNERLDAISIAVPTREHHQVAIAALDRRINVLVEKPLAMSSDVAREIIARAAGAKVVLAVGHIERFNPAIVALQHELRAGALGTVFEIKARRTGPFPERIKDVGVVIDLATHDLDLMLKLTGAHVERVACETTRNIHTEHEDALLALIRFSNGAIGSLDVNWLSPCKTRDLTIIGARGMFVVDYLTQQLWFHENGIAQGGWDHLARLAGVSEGRMIRLLTEREEPLRAELRSFTGSVRTRTAPEVTGEDGLQALLAAEALLESASSGTVTTVHDSRQPLLVGG
jgi:UDP-N-acetylglucosamine 3-dehydrogenase